MPPRLVRAARAMLGLSQQELAQICLVSWTSLNAFERERSKLSGRTRRAIVAALEGQGVIFLNDGGNGIGVRLAKPEAR